MSAFRFRLERLLRVRTIEEELAREAWIEAQNKARAAEADALLKRTAVAEALNGLRRRQEEKTIAPALIVVEHLHLEQLRRAHGRAELHARLVAADAARSLAAWRVSDTAKQGLERLEEKARAAHVLEENQKEARVLDEVASMRAARATRTAAIAARASRNDRLRSGA